MTLICQAFLVSDSFTSFETAIDGHPLLESLNNYHLFIPQQHESYDYVMKRDLKAVLSNVSYVVYWGLASDTISY